MKTAYPKNWDYLTSSQKRGKLAQAYLFCGPEGVGKRELAIDFSRLVSGLNLSDDKIIASGHPDILYVEPKKETKKNQQREKDISIQQIKLAMEKIYYFPYEAKVKLLIVNQAEKMTNSAANSLLKITEEPPLDTIIILITSNEDQILPTLRSRLRKIYFGLKGTEEMRAFINKEISDSLIGKNFSAEKLELIVRLAQGKIKKAQMLLGQVEYLEKTKNDVDRFRAALRSGIIPSFELAEQLSQDSQRMGESIQNWIWFLAEYLRGQVLSGQDPRRQKLLLDMTKRLVELRRDIFDTNSNARLLLENYFVQINWPEKKV